MHFIVRSDSTVDGTKEMCREKMEGGGEELATE